MLSGYDAVNLGAMPSYPARLDTFSMGPAKPLSLDVTRTSFQRDLVGERLTLSECERGLKKQEELYPAGRPPAPTSWPEQEQRLLRPYRPLLRDVLEVAKTVTQPQELLEALKTREIIPPDFLDHVQGFQGRGFFDHSPQIRLLVKRISLMKVFARGNQNSSLQSWIDKEQKQLSEQQCSRKANLYPPTLKAMIAVCSDPEGILQAETLALEFVQRLRPWKEEIPTHVFWERIDSEWSGQYLRGALKRDAFLDTFAEPREDYSASYRATGIRAKLFNEFSQRPSLEKMIGELFSLENDWTHACEKGISVIDDPNHPLHGKPYSDFPNPYEPLTGFNGLVSLGYAVSDIRHFTINGKPELCLVLGVPSVGVEF